MSGLATIKAGVVVLTLLVHWAGYNILDLSSGLVHILLPIWFILHLSLLPCMGLMYGMSILLRLKSMLVVIICRSVVLHMLVLSFYHEGLVHQRLKIWKVEHAESTPEVLI